MMIKLIKNMIESIDYEKIIKSLEEKLPSLPQILEDLVKKLSDPNSNLDSVEELVEVDQSITTQVLQVANKVEFTEPGEERITTIHDALHKLGFENAKKIALNVSVLKLMKLTKSTVNFSGEDLWQHSLAVAVASSEISKLVGYDNPDQAYACGLDARYWQSNVKLEVQQEGFRRRSWPLPTGKISTSMIWKS